MYKKFNKGQSGSYKRQKSNLFYAYWYCIILILKKTWKLSHINTFSFFKCFLRGLKGLGHYIMNPLKTFIAFNLWCHFLKVNLNFFLNISQIILVSLKRFQFHFEQYFSLFRYMWNYFCSNPITRNICIYQAGPVKKWDKVISLFLAVKSPYFQYSW